MKQVKKSLNRTVLRIGVCLLMVVLCFTGSLHGAVRESSLFTGNPLLFNQNNDGNRLFRPYAWSGEGYRSNQVQSLEIEDQPRVSRKKLIFEISMGVLFNIAGICAGGLIGSEIPGGDDDDNDMAEGIMGVSGAFIGSTLGSALGVYVAGNSKDVKGSFGSALLGSLLGEAAACGLLALSMNGFVVIFSFAVLPPLGAALLFNSSLKHRTLPVSHALLNFTGDGFKIGFPYFHIQPLPGYAKNVKPTLKFDINLVSIVL
jgi:hypothetical protein